MPQNCGFAAPNRVSRTTECTPSAPTTSFAVDWRAGFEAQLDVVRGLRKPDAFAAQMNGAGLCLQQRLRDDAMQIAAMDGDVGKAVALDRFQAEIEQLPALPGIPQPDRLAGRQHLHLLQRLLEPERMKDARAVGADLHAGAELAQFRRLLVDIDSRCRAGVSASAAARPPMPPPTIATEFLLIPNSSLVPLPLVGRG